MAQIREPKTEQEILQSFQSQRNELRSLAAKIEELASDSAEHGLVLKTLKPMQKERKCFRLIGGVLVERTIQDVAPSLKENKDQIDLVRTQENICTALLSGHAESVITSDFTRSSLRGFEASLMANSRTCSNFRRNIRSG